MKGQGPFLGTLSILAGFLIYVRIHMRPTSLSVTESSQHAAEYHHDAAVAPPPPYVSEMAKTDWLAAASITRILFESAEQCPLCRISASASSANSSPQDLILGVELGSSRNALTFVRSLRSTGSRATCCLIVDRKFCDSCTSFVLDQFRLCGLSLLSIGSFAPEFERKSHNARFLLYYQFLSKFNKYFRRAILVDPLETVFQTDPFTVNFRGDAISIGCECVTYNDSERDRSILEQIDPDVTAYLPRRVVNPGLIWGSVSAILKMLNVVIGSDFFVHFDTANFARQADGAALAVATYRRLLEGQDISVRLDDGTSAFGSMNFCKYRITNEKVVMRKTVKQNIVMSVVNQYNRYLGLLNWTVAACPALGGEHSAAHAERGYIFFAW